MTMSRVNRCFRPCDVWCDEKDVTSFISQSFVSFSLSWLCYYSSNYYLEKTRILGNVRAAFIFYLAHYNWNVICFTRAYDWLQFITLNDWKKYCFCLFWFADWRFLQLFHSASFSVIASVLSISGCVVNLAVIKCVWAAETVTMCDVYVAIFYYLISPSISLI